MSHRIAATLVAASLGVAAAAQEPGVREAGALRFAWPIPSEVTVTEKALKKGRRAKMRYRVEVVRDDAGDALRVRLRDFEFLEIQGLDLSTPAVRRALAPLTAMTSAIPDLIVSDEGEFLRIAGLDAMIDRVVEFLKRNRTGARRVDPGMLARTMKSPRMRPVLEQSVARFWNVWAGAWSGLEIGPGEEIENEVRVPLSGVTLPARATIRHLGPVPGAPDHVRLTWRAVVEGADAGDALATFVKTAFAETIAASGKPFPEGLFEEIRVVDTAEVVTDPGTLRPRTAKWAKVVSVKMKNEVEPRELVERHEYGFDWRAPEPTEKRD